MEKNEHTITRIMLSDIIDDLRVYMLDQNDKMVDETLKILKKEYENYKKTN